MNIAKLTTPQFLVDREALMHNIEAYAQLAKKHGKRLMPMTKTHKSSYIAKLQAEAGASGFLCGTLIEAEKLAPMGLPVVLAYPFIGEANLARIFAVAQTGKLFVSLDSIEAARAYDAYFKARGARVSFYLLVNTGLDRLGVAPEECGDAAKAIIAACPTLDFYGIASHPGQVYGCQNDAEVRQVAGDEVARLKIARASLDRAGLSSAVIASGSTPTYREEAESDFILELHPGNYVFNDAIQLANGTASLAECAFTVLATVIAHPAPDRFILDCGSKCLGLDKGAHGNASIVGFGKILGHDELEIFSLSEEISNVRINGATDVKIGDRVRVIPNHSCSAANMCGYMILTSGDETVALIETDMRGNSAKPVID